QHETSPALSPDGTQLAFARYHDDGCVMFLYQMGTNTPAKRLAKCGPYYPGIRWVSNHEFLYVAEDSDKTAGALHRFDIQNSQITDISSPPPGEYDIAMALSQEGSQAAFFRTSDWKQSDLYTINLNTGEETFIESYPRLIWDLAWTNNDQSIVYVPDADRRRLEALNPQTGEKATAYQQKISFKLEGGLRHSNKLFINEREWDNNIHAIPLSSPVSALKDLPNEAIVASTKSEWLPKETLDGKFISFLSERTGNIEIWITDKDGQNQRQLSNFNGTLSVDSYSWNNAGNKIAFQTYADTIYLLDVTTGEHSKISAPEGLAKLPVFTPSDQHIVFTAQQDGDWQLWQTPVTGGSPEQITSDGGYSARFSRSGELIFTKHSTGGLWKFDFETNSDLEIAPSITVYPIRQWVLRDGGAYYGKDYEGRVQVFFYDWETQQSKRLFDTPHWLYTFEISGDEEEIFFTRDVSKGGDIMMLQ
ncbi:MAG: TolB family protein, partial [Kordiimonas sp.]